MNESQAILGLAALAQETRLAIVRFLVKAGRKGAPAGMVADAVGASSSRFSFHIGHLERAGLVKAERRSRQILYSVDFAHIGALLAFVMEDCCGGDPQVRACCGTKSAASGLDGE